ncbi:hypothetical protein ACFOGJ_12765 [Marinibaculum pumilum]|uniref:Transposase TnpC homeodomain domain-containing protein n=1 Tax=Marinibaculum pumilum TaxID=1766165 RepID=A0ABV7L0I0_9PROT|nr:hypothetical protein C8255_23310 [filamentous cyanobacterium CCP3]
MKSRALRRLLLAEREAAASAVAELTGQLQQARTGLVAKTLELEKLKVQLAKLRRMAFGRSSEKLEPWAGRTTCSPAPTPARSAPRPSTR